MVVLAHLKTVDDIVVMNSECNSGDIIGGVASCDILAWVVQLCFDNFVSQKSLTQTEDINFSFHPRHEFASSIIPGVS